MGIAGVYYTEQNNLQDILTGSGHQPALDMDKTWSLIAGMYPEIPLVPAGKEYKVASDALYGSFYLLPMTNNDTYEDLVEGYLLPHLQSLFDLFEESAAQGHGLVFMIV